MNIRNLYDQSESWMIELRRWFHRHPELSLQEKETSGKIQEELTKLGIPYQVLAPNYGIVATIQGSRPGKKIVLRADIDALPVTEETGLSFASEHPGVMHACGHDAHAAMLLGAARILQENKDELCGTVICLFQVAEETGFGYKEALDHFDSIGGVDGVIGLHIWSAVPEGEIVLLPGSIFAGGKGYDLKVKGQGGHGGRPDLDTAAALRACEIDADCLMKATKVDGIYDADPKTHPEAVRFDTITYREVLTRDLKVMDATATALCSDNNMSMIVFNIDQQGVFADALKGMPVGTTVVGEETH